MWAENVKNFILINLSLSSNNQIDAKDQAKKDAE